MAHAREARASFLPVAEVGAGGVIDGTGADAVPGALEVIGSGIERGLHLGAQVYVSVDGTAVADLGVGEARAGVPMTRDSMVIWFSMTKPSVAFSL